MLNTMSTVQCDRNYRLIAACTAWRANRFDIPMIGAQSSASWTTDIVIFDCSGGLSMATFLLGFLEPSAFLLRFLVVSDMLLW